MIINLIIIGLLLIVWRNQGGLSDKIDNLSSSELWHLKDKR